MAENFTASFWRNFWKKFPEEESLVRVNKPNPVRSLLQIALPIQHRCSGSPQWIPEWNPDQSFACKSKILLQLGRDNIDEHPFGICPLDLPIHKTLSPNGNHCLTNVFYCLTWDIHSEHFVVETPNWAILKDRKEECQIKWISQTPGLMFACSGSCSPSTSSTSGRKRRWNLPNIQQQKMQTWKSSLLSIFIFNKFPQRLQDGVTITWEWAEKTVHGQILQAYEIS